MDHAELRRAILEVSLKLGTELGEEGLTMRAIARRLKVSATALYQHFESKGAILRELRFHGLQQLNAHLAPAFELHDPVAQLRDHGQRYLRFSRANPWMYDLLTQSPEDWGPNTDGKREVAVESIRAVGAALAACQALGKLREGINPTDAPLMMWAALHGMALLMGSGRVSPTHSHFPSADESVVIADYADYVVRSFVSLH